MSTSTTSTLDELYKTDFKSLITPIVDLSVIGSATHMQLNLCCENFSSEKYEICVETSNIILDFLWEILNQGNWKDININWRYVYTVVSAMKALSEYKLVISENPSFVFEQSLKSCDMGLLMGAPVCDNILAQLCMCIQHDYKQRHPKEEACKDSTHQRMLNKSCKKTEHQATETIAEYEPVEKKFKYGESNLTFINGDSEIPRISCPSLEAFCRDFVSSQTPVIITDSMDHWPALSSREWTLEYIKDKAGYRTVPIEIGSKYTDDAWSQKLMTVRNFIEQYIEKKEPDKCVGYLAQHQLFNQIPELQEDIVVPDYCYLGEDTDSVDINAWFGPCGTVSPLHFDPKHNFLAQVIGSKYIQIYAASESDKLYPHMTTLLKNTSQVDIENPDLHKYPLFKEAVCVECVLKSGEMLYIPPKYWHFVKSLSVSFSVSFWWE